MKITKRLLFATSISLSWSVISAPAAIISWGTPTAISADSDVLNAGVTTVAITTPDAGNGAQSTTLNGVSFVPLNYTGGAYGWQSPNGVLTTGTGGVNAGGSASGVDAAYDKLLGTTFYTTSGSTATMSLSLLNPNDRYLLQAWYKSDNGAVSPLKLANTPGNGSSSVIVPNGDYVTGSFTADATTEQLLFGGNGTFNALNAFQLRDIGALPEPSTVILLALGGLLLRRVAGCRPPGGRIRALPPRPQ